MVFLQTGMAVGTFTCHACSFSAVLSGRAYRDDNKAHQPKYTFGFRHILYHLFDSDECGMLHRIACIPDFYERYVTESLSIPLNNIKEDTRWYLTAERSL